MACRYSASWYLPYAYHLVRSHFTLVVGEYAGSKIHGKESAFRTVDKTSRFAGSRSYRLRRADAKRHVAERLLTEMDRQGNDGCGRDQQLMDGSQVAAPPLNLPSNR